jgi:hypothetical protein
MRTLPVRYARLAAACLLAATILLGACDRAPGKSEDPAAAKVAEAAANPSFSVDAGARPILALRVRLTADTVSVQDARFLRAPLRGGDGQPDLLVLGMAGDRIVHRYPIPDPLNAQVESQDKGLHGTLRLPQAVVWIYMPATRFDVIEISPGRNDPALPRGGRIQIGPVLDRLCSGQKRVEDCAAAALAAQPGEGDDASANPSSTPPKPGA